MACARVWKQFGQSIGAFQAVQHKRADSRIRLDGWRLQLLSAARALLGTDAPDAPANGLIEEILRLSIMHVVGGGSNDIQRSLIATRGLGLG